VNLASTARVEIFVGAAAGGFQAAGFDVGLDSPVLLIGQEFLKPLREAVKFLGWKLTNGGLEFFDTRNA
jgi:hypothetical protein